MKIDQRLRRIADYVAATENEIAVDVNFLSIAGLAPATAGYLPRSPKWVALGQRCPFWTRWSWRGLWLFWAAGGAALYFLWQLVKCLRARRGAPAAPLATPAAAVVAFSSRTGDILNDRQFPDLPATWYTLPWVPLAQVPANAVLIDLFSLLSRAQLWAALRDALHATYLLLRRRRTRPWLLQSYTAFRWFAVRSALDLHPCRLVMADHFDRWAVLADSAVCAWRAAPGAGCVGLSLVQHGSLAKLDDEDGKARAGLRLYRRLRAVTRLYAYGPDAVQAFKATILSAACAARLEEAVLFVPQIELDGPREAAMVRLLFVGSPMCEEFHRSLFMALAARHRVQVFYKPHPKAPMSDSMRHVGWEVIDQPRRFPAVELLVSYESTLVLEYQAAGVGAVVHPINSDSARTDEVLEQIDARIAALDKRIIAA